MRRVDQAKYDERRGRILKAAHECFRRDGFHGASISDICAAAKMSPGHLYHYFDSKEAIVKALIESRLAQEAAFIAELSENTDLVMALSMLIDRRLTRLRPHRFSLFLEMIAESARNPSIAAIVRRAERGTRELVVRLIRQGQERGRLDSELDPDAAATIIGNIVFGLSHLPVVRGPTFDLNSAVDMLQLLMERFLRPQTIRRAKQISRRLPKWRQAIQQLEDRQDFVAREDSFPDEAIQGTSAKRHAAPAFKVVRPMSHCG